MNVRKYIFAIVLAMVALYACKSDDDNDITVEEVPTRDRAEQQVTDDALLQIFLETHFYKPEDVFINDDDVPEYQIVTFHTIEGTDSDEQSIMDSDLLTTKKITSNDVEYTLYILNLQKGDGEMKPTFADSTFVTYRGKLLDADNENLFDSAINPTWLDQVTVLEGWREALVDFKGATGFVENTDDGSVRYNNDYGDLVVFMPSGLAYFSEVRVGIPAYSPLIFNIQLYNVAQSDHDADGIPSYLEDLDGDRNVFDIEDNTDEDGSPNYQDIDDDGDGTLTSDEITVIDSNLDGIITLNEITFYDDDGDGVKNHLDPDDRDVKNN